MVPVAGSASVISATRGSPVPRATRRRRGRACEILRELRCTRTSKTSGIESRSSIAGTSMRHTPVSATTQRGTRSCPELRHRRTFEEGSRLGGGLGKVGRRCRPSCRTRGIHPGRRPQGSGADADDRAWQRQWTVADGLGHLALHRWRRRPRGERRAVRQPRGCPQTQWLGDSEADAFVCSGHDRPCQRALRVLLLSQFVHLRGGERCVRRRGRDARGPMACPRGARDVAARGSPRRCGSEGRSSAGGRARPGR